MYPQALIIDAVASDVVLANVSLSHPPRIFLNVIQLHCQMDPSIPKSCCLHLNSSLAVTLQTTGQPVGISDSFHDFQIVGAMSRGYTCTNTFRIFII